MPVQSIQLAFELEEKHQIALLKSITNPIALTSDERQDLIEGINLIRSSCVQINDHKFTFSKFFDQFIDKFYTDTFIDSLLNSERVFPLGRRLKKQIIKGIRTQFIDEQWIRPDIPETRFLIAFCLYWWNAIAIGYMFELEVFRDLRDSGLHFQPHNLRKRSERYSFADLLISEMKGDIKSSTYFFSLVKSSGLPHDFYITRYYSKSDRQYYWFVILRLKYWDRIDGETKSVIFPKWIEDFSSPVNFTFNRNKWVAVSYQIWKTKMSAYQKGQNNEIQNN